MIGKNLIKGFDGHFEGAVSTLELRPRPSTCSCISSKDDHVFVVGLWIGTSSQYQMFEANLQIRYKMSKSLQRSSFSQGKRWDEDNFVGLICLSKDMSTFKCHVDTLCSKGGLSALGVLCIKKGVLCFMFCL